MSSNIYPLVITRNEQIHIARLLDILSASFNYILVVDSFSSDDTVKLAQGYSNVDVVQRKFLGFSDQLNFGVDRIANQFGEGWFFRIDADEVISTGCINTLKIAVSSIPNAYSTVSVVRKFIFRNKVIRFGGYGDIRIARLGRIGNARFDSYAMDEKLHTLGLCYPAECTIYDHNLNDIDFFIQKHLSYSNLELINIFGPKPARESKKRLYYRLPITWRPVMLFFYRYIIRGGFLGGGATFYFIFFQTLFYRMLVDYKIRDECNAVRLSSALYRDPPSC
jgi:glycosyltransferase involved in cell wall biosynthesis